MLDTTKIYQDSVRLIQKAGAQEIEGMPLKEYLSFEGISLWSLVETLLASDDLPEAILRMRRKEISEVWRHLYYKRFKSHLKSIWSIAVREMQDSHLPSLVLPEAGKGPAQNILYLCFEPRQVEDFIPVMDLLMTRGNFRFDIIGSKYRANWHHCFNRQNKIFSPIEDLFPGVKKRVDSNRRLLKQRMKKVLKPQFWSALQYDGTSLWRLLGHDLRELFIYTFPQLLKEIYIADRLISLRNPRIVVGVDDCNPRQRIYFFLARLKGIPTFVVQQGFAFEKSVEWMFPSCEKIAALGDDSRNILKTMGIRDEQMVLTGQPRFDRLTKKENLRASLCKKFNIDPGMKIVFFTSQPNVAGCFTSNQNRIEMIKSIYGAIYKGEGFVIIIKPHPDEEEASHRLLISRMNSPRLILIDKNAKTQDFILGCDVLLTFHSTTAIEAMIAAKPVIIFDPSRKFTATPYVHEGAALGVGNPEEICTAMHELFYNPVFYEKMKRDSNLFIRRYVHNVDGLAAKRVSDYIITTLNKE